MAIVIYFRYGDTVAILNKPDSHTYSAIPLFTTAMFCTEWHFKGLCVSSSNCQLYFWGLFNAIWFVAYQQYSYSSVQSITSILNHENKDGGFKMKPVRHLASTNCMTVWRARTLGALTSIRRQK